MKKRIVLGSKSLWRRTLLDKAGFVYEIKPPNIDEKSIRNENPRELTLMLAHAKADKLIPECDKDIILITSDQVMVCNGELIEKPESKENVYHFFDLYSKYPLSIISSVLVTNVSTGERKEAVDEAKIIFSPFTTAEVEQIAEVENTYHCAGGILMENEIIKNHIVSIEGDMSTIMGMPMEQTLEFISLFEK